MPATSNNADTITLTTDKGEIKLESLRQQLKKAVGQPSYSLADFIKPGPSPQTDWIVGDPAKSPFPRGRGIKPDIKWQIQ
ncbi:MAG: hypothetical protein IPI78_08865 [Chitinophagaceae bacterium]|nr:hypothetical protein [Chitinophagaceae bacterium]